MKPVTLYQGESSEELRRKLITLIDDIYNRFNQVQDNVMDFNTNRVFQQPISVAADSDEVDTDVASHESTYDHDLLHTQNTDTDLDATFEASLKNCDNHTSGSTNFVLAQQAAEADLNQTISSPPTQAEVQAISDKVDAILAKLRSANVLAT